MDTRTGNIASLEALRKALGDRATNTYADPRQDERMSAAVARARHAWEQRGVNSTIALTFDDLLSAFLDPTVTLGQIGVAADCTRERVRQIRRDYFGELVPSPRVSQRRRTLLRSEQRLRELAPVGLAATFAEAALRHGVRVMPCVYRRSGSYFGARSNRVIVTGCTIHCFVSRAPYYVSAASRRKMYHFSLRMMADDFAAFYCQTAPLRCWFIIPRAELERRGKLRQLYIPECNADYKGSLRHNGWLWQYREAWHLLSEAT